MQGRASQRLVGAMPALAGRLEFRGVWLALGWAGVALVVYLSLTPDPLPQASAFGFDAGHAVAYAWLMFWFAQIERGGGARLRIALALCALGAGLEVLQGATDYRVFSWADMRDDAIGVALGGVAAASPLASALPWLDARLARFAGRLG